MIRNRYFSGNKNRTPAGRTSSLGDIASKRAKAIKSRANFTPEPEPASRITPNPSEIKEREFQKWQEKQRKKPWSY